ncbi:MAG: serine protease [Lachnospiraceae bacterium]|nr:serine protease [Lachnospiraceae bacterium]
MEEKDQNYEFMTETIKKHPVNKRKLFRKIFSTIILGILFGACAAATFVMFMPRLQAYLYPVDETKPVSLPVDESIQEEEPVEPFVMPENDSSNDAADPDKAQSPEETAKPDEDAQDTSKPADAEKPEEEKEVVVNNIVETIEKDLELDDYRSLLRKISAIADATSKSLVTVAGVSSNTDWFNNSYENNNSTTGIIIADNGKELLIVSPSDILHKARNVRVTFCDGVTYPARVKDADINTDLCIVSIDLEHIEEKTMEQIEMAQFGGIATSAVGVPVVAVGSPYGAAGSVGMGQITSNSVIVDKSDSNVRIISTDIYASVDGSGVLVNYNGRIVGIICHEDMSGNMPNLLRAYAVSDISDSIEKISNGQSLATLGIIGTDVTPEANADRNVPFGAYVKEVIADSPAMNVGIRNGDVIVKFGTTQIESFSDYKKAILEYQPQDVVMVTLERPGRDEYTEMTYEVTLEELK